MQAKRLSTPDLSPTKVNMGEINVGSNLRPELMQQMIVFITE